MLCAYCTREWILTTTFNWFIRKAQAYSDPPLNTLPTQTAQHPSGKFSLVFTL